MDQLLQRLSIAAQIDGIIRRDQECVANGQPSKFTQKLPVSDANRHFRHRMFAILASTQTGDCVQSILLDDTGQLITRTYGLRYGSEFTSACGSATDWSYQFLERIAPGLDRLEEELFFAN